MVNPWLLVLNSVVNPEQILCISITNPLQIVKQHLAEQYLATRNLGKKAGTFLDPGRRPYFLLFVFHFQVFFTSLTFLRASMGLALPWPAGRPAQAICLCSEGRPGQGHSKMQESNGHLGSRLTFLLSISSYFIPILQKYQPFLSSALFGNTLPTNTLPSNVLSSSILFSNILLCNYLLSNTMLCNILLSNLMLNNIVLSLLNSTSLGSLAKP